MRNIIWSTLLLSLCLVSTIFAQGSDPTCGNPPKKCDPCASAGANPFCPYSGVVTREVTDLEAAYQVGELSMDLTRTTISRLDPPVKIAFDSPFGNGGHWRHSFQWDILWNTNDIGAEKIRIIYPDGGWGNFDYDGANSEYMTFLASTYERIKKVETNYYLMMLDGTSHHFTKDESTIPPTYQMQASYDPYSNKTEYVYSSNRLVKVLGPNTNQFLKFSYKPQPNSVQPGPIEFSYTEPDEYDSSQFHESVQLRGSFSDWLPVPMTLSGRVWRVTLDLTNGWHYYKFTGQYEGDPTLYWYTDPDNEMWTYPDNNSVAVIDPPRLLTSVESSDGRTVYYQYDWSHGMEIINLMLTNVIYGTSGLNAEYTYYPSEYDLNRNTLLHTADDPMYSGIARNIEYIYETNNIYSGRIWLERSGVDGQLLSELQMSYDQSNPYYRYVIDAAGNTNYVELAEESGSVNTEVNAVGYTNTSEYWGGNGMLSKRTDASNRTWEYGRTLHFGAVTNVTGPRGTRTIRYTNDDEPFYKIETVDELNRTNLWMRDSYHRVVKRTFESGNYETFDYNVHGQVLTNTLRDTTSKRIFTYDAKGRKVSETDPSCVT